MYPMDLEEFMMALGRRDIVEEIRKAYQTDKPLSSIVHDLAMQIWCQYLAVGGMPACVAHFVETRDHLLVRHLQDTILASYRDDMGKFSTSAETKKKRLLWDSIPEQLAKESSRFQYALVKQGRRLTMLDHAVELLCEAGIAYRVYRVSEGKKPLDCYVDIGAFQLYSADPGLLAAQRNLAPAEILYMREKSRIQEKVDPFLCGLVENYVAVQLQQNGLRTRYWYPKGGAQYVFVTQLSGKTIPIAVQTVGRQESGSLKKYVDAYHPAYAIRLCMENFGLADGVRTVPLYAAFCLEEDAWWKEGA